MDDNTLKLFESASRIYLESCGQDPDAEVKIPHPTLKGMTMTVPVWHLAAEELLDLSRKMSAMKKAKDAFVPKAVILT